LPVPDEDALYRQAHFSKLTGPAGGRFPKASHFVPDEDGLSVHWDRYIGTAGIYILIGLTYRPGKTVFKDPKDFTVFSLPVSFIRSLEGVAGVIHTPHYSGNPAPVGSPNNYAHTSLLYPKDEEIRIKLSDFCHDTPGCLCHADIPPLETEIAALRERLDNTPYHRIQKN
jgi:hypothetical protein